jgi:hypothetical protein
MRVRVMPAQSTARRRRGADAQPCRFPAVQMGEVTPEQAAEEGICWVSALEAERRRAGPCRLVSRHEPTRRAALHVLSARTKLQARTACPTADPLAHRSWPLAVCP